MTALICLACASWLTAEPSVPASIPASVSSSRLAYLDAFCDPYPVHRSFPRLITPQWVGEPGVEAVVVLAIDDMRGHEKWEAYLRPILERLKRHRKRAAVSIMTCDIDPQHPHLRTWLQEGVSLEAHTADHPCPLLGTGGFDAAKGTYDRCVDKMATIPGSFPVAFRTPCCDSRNTPSPRMFAEIVGRTTPAGRFLSIDSSVFNVFTSSDPRVPREIALQNGRERFAKYLPFSSFVNTIENYPYPYVIGKKCWEFPCATPSDWQGQNINKPNSPLTLDDMKASLDATVALQGVYCLVFHPHGWMHNTQVNELVDHAVERHSHKVLFLSFRECLDRMEKYLLASSSLRTTGGDDNGVRLIDLNDDGFMDVLIGNEAVRLTRLWDPATNTWHESVLPFLITEKGIDQGVRFGVLGNKSAPIALVLNEHRQEGWRFNGTKWEAHPSLCAGLEQNGRSILATRGGRDLGVRLRDLNGDGADELISGNEQNGAVLQWDPAHSIWMTLKFSLPAGTSVVDAEGRDAGLRFVDLNRDGFDDVLFSDDEQYSVDLFDSMEAGWVQRIRSGRAGEVNGVPPIARDGMNNGVFFKRGSLWVQNETTATLPDMVDRRSFEDLIRGRPQ